MSGLSRRNFLIYMGTCLLGGVPGSAFAQHPTRPFRIGVLAVASAANWATRVEALRIGLQDLGYFEGKNILVEVLSAEGKYDRLPELAAELVRKKVDVIVTAGTPAIRAAKQVTDTIPIVIAAVGDAVAGGFVSSLSKPGGNITGSTYFAPELAGKQLELLKEAFPQTTRVAVVMNPDNPAMGPTLQSVVAASRPLQLELEQFAVRAPADFERVFAHLADKGHTAVLIIDDPITIANAKALADLALAHRLVTAGFIEYAEAGGLIGYGVNLVAMWRRAAFFVDKILNGTRPGQIPVERSMRFSMVVNRKAAQAIEVGIAPSILLRADRLIE